MRSLVHIVFFLLIGIGAKAQQNYFVYIQTENKQPFTVKLNDKTMNSSTTGYVVIPKLSNGNYMLNISFAKNEYPAQSLGLTIANDDAGYLLKNFGEKGWGLYNIRTAEIAMSNGVKQTGEGDDVFTATLSGAANTNLSTTPVKDPVKPVAIPVVQQEKKQTEKLPEVNGYASVAIKKTEGTNSSDGVSMVYVDQTAAGRDTINIFIPAVIVTEKKEPVVQNNEEKTVPAKDTKFLDIELQNPNTKPADTPVVTKAAVVELEERPLMPVADTPKDKPVVSFNSDCKMNARDGEFIKLRKKMAGENTDEAMVADAEKMFKQMCWSVEQVKSLSMLLSTDAGRYMFFESAYAHIYDTQHFSSLQSQLTDTYYINWFKALIRN